jgi:hypothetical protein
VAFSIFAREAIIDGLTGATAMPQWDTYLGLHTFSGSFVEITGNNYGRALVDWDTPGYLATFPAGTYCFPATNVVFPTQTPARWFNATTVYTALYDAPTGGNRLTDHDAAIAPLTTTIGKQLVWPTDGLKVGFSELNDSDDWRGHLLGWLLKVPGFDPGQIAQFAVAEYTDLNDSTQPEPSFTGYSRQAPVGWTTTGTSGERALSAEQTLWTVGAGGYSGGGSLVVYAGGMYASGVATFTTPTWANGDLVKARGVLSGGLAVKAFVQ